MPQGHTTPSLYEMLYANFTGGLARQKVIFSLCKYP